MEDRTRQAAHRETQLSNIFAMKMQPGRDPTDRIVTKTSQKTAIRRHANAGIDKAGRLKASVATLQIARSVA